MSKTIEEVAQWVINNRYPKSELEKLSDHELYYGLIEKIELLLEQFRAQEQKPVDYILEEPKMNQANSWWCGKNAIMPFVTWSDAHKFWRENNKRLPAQEQKPVDINAIIKIIEDEPYGRGSVNRDEYKARILEKIEAYYNTAQEQKPVEELIKWAETQKELNKQNATDSMVGWSASSSTFMYNGKVAAYVELLEKLNGQNEVNNKETEELLSKYPIKRR